MNLIIAGSRNIHVSASFISDVLRHFGVLPPTVDSVICGMANGVDMCGKAWAEHWCLPVVECPADWDKYGRSAGPIRNEQMARKADTLLLIWDGSSKGSSNMKGHMKYKTIHEVVLK